MYEEELNNKASIKTQEVVDSTSKGNEIEKEESLPPSPPPPRVLTSIKRWSENKQRYFYKPKDPDYAKNHYWKHKHDMQCLVCGAIVTTAMYRHVKSLRCLWSETQFRKRCTRHRLKERKLHGNSKLNELYLNKYLLCILL